MLIRVPPLWIPLLRVLAIGALVFWGLGVWMGWQQVGRPFPGFLSEPNLLVSTIRPAHWNGAKAGLASYDRLLTADGAALNTTADLDRAIAKAGVGRPIRYVLQHGGTIREVLIAPQLFGIEDWIECDAVFQLTGLVFLLTGLVVFILRPWNPASQAHLLVTVAFGLFLGDFACWNQAHVGATAYMVLMWLIGGSFLHLVLVFPEASGLARRYPWIQALPYLPMAVAAAVVLACYRPLGQTADPVTVAFYLEHLNVWSVWTTMGVLGLLGGILRAAFRSGSGRARSQARIVLLGATGAFFPQVFLFFAPKLLGDVSAISSLSFLLGILGFHLFPISIAYAIVRHRLFDIQLVIRRATLYLTLILSLGALYGLVVAFGHHLLETRLPTYSSLGLTGFVAALFLALAIRPLHDTLRQRIDRLFLGKRADALQLLTDFNHQATPDSLVLAQRLVALLRDAFDPRWIGLWVDGRLLASHGDLPALEPPPPAQSPRDLGRGLDDGALCLANPQEFLVLGPRANDMPYNSEETALFTALGAQARLAFDHARLFQAQLHLSIQEGIVREVAKEREQLLRQVVHDLGSDIFSIALGLRLLKRPAEAERAFGSIQRSLAHMQDLLEEKSAYLREGRAIRQACLSAVMQQVREAMTPVFGTRSQILEVRGLDDEALVPLSELELEQVLVNLLTNAAKFSPEGSTVRLEVVCEAPRLVIRVADEGSGIPAAFMERIATGARAQPEIPGSGFGLQNVKAILEKAAGELSWRNTEQGAVFEVRLACARSETCPALRRGTVRAD